MNIFYQYFRWDENSKRRRSSETVFKNQTRLFFRSRLFHRKSRGKNSDKNSKRLNFFGLFISFDDVGGPSIQKPKPTDFLPPGRIFSPLLLPLFALLFSLSLSLSLTLYLSLTHSLSFSCHGFFPLMLSFLRLSGSCAASDFFLTTI